MPDLRVDLRFILGLCIRLSPFGILRYILVAISEKLSLGLQLHYIKSEEEKTPSFQQLETVILSVALMAIPSTKKAIFTHS